MRSPEEQTYWYVRFWYDLKVRVWFADKPELNEDTHNASLFRFLEGWRAGGSNEERKNKSISGQFKALQSGRYPFVPKAGYMKGSMPGIPEKHPIKAPALQKVLIAICNGEVTPTQGLKDLNKSPFITNGHSLYKMDKFSKIATDPFYAGVVEMNKQVQYRNENGLHKPLITLDQHYRLLRIFEAKGKNQSGPRKNGNPLFPLNNILSCDLCVEATNGRFVGFSHSNGKNLNRIYQKYRCRSCGRYMSRDELHQEVANLLRHYEIPQENVKVLIKALKDVWKRQESQVQQDMNRLRQQIEELGLKIRSQAIAAIDPSNASIKDEILASVSDNKALMSKLEDELSNLASRKEGDWESFLNFAIEFVNDMAAHFLTLSQESRLKCKQIIFPSGFRLDVDKKVYTPEISPLYRLLTNKKDAEAPQKSLMVRVRRL